MSVYCLFHEEQKNIYNDFSKKFKKSQKIPRIKCMNINYNFRLYNCK